MVFRYLDRASQAVSGAPGTGNITLGGALAGYQTVVQAGVTNNDTFSYLAVDGTAWEIGVATFTSAGINGTLTRTVTKTSNQNTTPLSLSSFANVSAILRAEDLGGETSSLENLTDVNINEATISDQEVLTWDLASGKWVATVPSGGGGSTTLASLTDVNVTEGAPIDGYSLVWHNATSRWIAYNVSGGGGSTTLATLTDVNVTEGPGINGYTLNWNNAAGKWEAVAPVSPTGFSLTVSDNGTAVDTAATTLNFVNATSITTSAHDVTITLPTGGGGGGGGLYNQVMSATPTQAGTGLATWLNQGSSTVADSAVGVSFNIAPNSLSISGKVVAAPATPYTITALVGITRVPNSYDGMFFGWYDGSSKLHVMNVVSNNHSINELNVEKWSSYSTNVGNDFSTSAGSSADFPTPIWLRIADDGTNAIFSFSYDGANFLTIFSVAKSSGYLGGSGYTDVIFGASCANGSLHTLVSLMSWAIT